MTHVDTPPTPGSPPAEIGQAPDAARRRPRAGRRPRGDGEALGITDPPPAPAGDGTDGEHAAGATRRGRWARTWRRWWRSWVFLWVQVLLGVGALAYLILALVTAVTLVFAPGQYLGRAVFPLGRTMAAGGLRMSVWLLDRSSTIRFPKHPRGRTVGETLVALARSRATWRAYGWLMVSIPMVILHAFAVAVFPLASVWGPLWARACAGMLRAPVQYPTGVSPSAELDQALGRASEAGQTPHHHGKTSAQTSDSPIPMSPETGKGGAGAGSDESGDVGKRVPGSRARHAGVEGPASAAGKRPHGGYGLAGMRERVAAVGGSLEAGPTSDGGFAVRAVLPVGMRWAARVTTPDERATTWEEQT